MTRFRHDSAYYQVMFNTDEQFLFYNFIMIGVSPLTGKKVKPSNNSAICDHLLHCNFLPSFDNFSVLAHENKKYLLEIKESLLIMTDKPSLNRNINSAPLYLFDKVS